MAKKVVTGKSPSAAKNPAIKAPVNKVKPMKTGGKLAGSQWRGTGRGK